MPGHHPETEQDKPERRPRLPKVDHRFAFRFDDPVAKASRLFGVNRDNAFVHVVGDTLTIRFGPWTIQTMTSNVDSAEKTGPYQWWKVIGPPRLSLKDRGATFATTTAGGVCIRFREPVAGALPGGWLLHPGVTVTVDEPDDLVALLNG
jgi:hypothetical protein